MKTLLLTAYDDAFAPIGDLTSARMLAYANRHGFDFHCARNIPESLPPSWYKVDLTAIALARYERVIWLDADQAITNPERVPSGNPFFHVSRDWGTDALNDSYFSMGGFVAYSDMRNLFMSIMRERGDKVNDPFWEQEPMRELYRQTNGEGFVVHPRRDFCAVPLAVQPSAPEPWQPGDWCAHLTSIPIEERVRIFHTL